MGETTSAAAKLPPAPTTDRGLAGTGGPDGFGGFGRSFLTDSVGRGGANRPEDVHTASSFLHANGFLDAPVREADEDFHRAIEAGQAKLNDLSNGGLHVDGRVKPFGPTEVLSQRAVTSRQMRAPAKAEGLSDYRKLVQRMQAEHAKDDGYLERLPGDLRAFYTAYQRHLRTQPYTTDPNARALQERNALIAGQEAAGATMAGPAFMQGLLGAGADAVEGLGQITGSRGMLDAGQRLRDRIEGAFPVPEHLRNTGSVRSAQGWGGLAPVAATGALGLARSASAKAGAALATGAVGAGQASRDLARQGAGSAEQRIGAFVGAVSEGLGPQGTRIAARQGANLLKTHLGLDLTMLATSEMKVLNDILAPRGLKVALDGAIRTISGKANEGPTVRR